MDDNQPIWSLTVGHFKELLREELKSNNACSESDNTLGEILVVEDIVKLSNYSKHTIYKMVENEGMPVLQRKKGTKILFDKQEVLCWLSNRKAKQNIDSSDIYLLKRKRK